MTADSISLLTFLQCFNNWKWFSVRICWPTDGTICKQYQQDELLTYDTPALRQTGSRNLTGLKTLPTIWGIYMKLVTKYQITAINSCWEKCDEKCAYMFNVYRNQRSRQTGSRNLTDPKTLPTIWYTYMMLVTKYQISAVNSYWQKCDEKYLGLTEGRTDRGKTVYPLPLRGAGV
jgi:hypothetical protein